MVNINTNQTKPKRSSKKAPWFIAQQEKNPMQPKPPAWLHRKSSKQRERDAKYLPIRDDYLAKHPLCEVCLKERANPPKRATEVHHKRGRMGKLLFDQRYFMAVCREDHVWIDANRAESRRRGYLCGVGEWGRQE